MGEHQLQAERRDAKPTGQTVASLRFDRKRLLPSAVVAPLRILARDFLSMPSRDQLLLVAVENGNRPVESGDMIEATITEIEATLAKSEADREADLAAIRADVEKRLAPFALILKQIDPTRRATVTAHWDGSAIFTPSDAATAHSTPCGQIAKAKNYKRPTEKKTSNVENKPSRRMNRHLAHAVSACHNCRRGTGDWCFRCRRVNQDDIRIKKNPHNIRPDLTTDPAAPDNPGADAPQATRLPANIENALRLFLATLATLPPIGILYLAHKATHRRESFDDFLRQTIAAMETTSIDNQSNIYHRFCRATLTLAWKRVVAKNPCFGVFQTWKGHSAWPHEETKRKHRKMTEDEKAAREAEVAADFDTLDVRNGGEIEDPEADRTFDRREPFAEDRDDDQTLYFFDDGS